MPRDAPVMIATLPDKSNNCCMVASSMTSEARWSLRQECSHALGMISAWDRLFLKLRLELYRLQQVALKCLIHRLLGECQRQRRALRKLRRPCVRLVH